MRKATLKASVSALTPKTEAKSTSRTRPVIREARVSRETVEADLSRDTGASVGAAKAPPKGRIRAENRNPAYNGGLCCIILRHLRNINMASAKPKKKNPRLASGRKRVRQDTKLNAANTSLRSKYRTAVKNVEKAVLAGDKTKASELFAKAQSIVDTVADKGIFHKNKAARDKSRLSAKVKALALAPEKAAA
jgi:small subunit ribosomal protein S20